MVFLPKFFIFFADVDKCIGAFYLGEELLLDWLDRLTLPVRCGGLALPDCRTYYWAAVLVIVRWWYVLSRSNAAMCLEAAVLGSLQELGNLIYRGHRVYMDLPHPTRMTLKV